MKTCFLAIATFLLLSHALYGQRMADGVYLRSDDEQISSIEKIKQGINNNLETFKKTEKRTDSIDYTFVYTKHNDIKLISIFSKDLDQNTDKVKQWYFDNGQLIYLEQVTSISATKKIIDTEKMYLSNNQLFAWFQSGKLMDRTSDRFKKTSEALQDYASKLKADTRSDLDKSFNYNL